MAKALIVDFATVADHHHLADILGDRLRQRGLAGAGIAEHAEYLQRVLVAEPLRDAIEKAAICCSDQSGVMAKPRYPAATGRDGGAIELIRK